MCTLKSRHLMLFVCVCMCSVSPPALPFSLWGAALELALIIFSLHGSSVTNDPVCSQASDSLYLQIHLHPFHFISLAQNTLLEMKIWPVGGSEGLVWTLSRSCNSGLFFTQRYCRGHGKKAILDLDKTYYCVPQGVCVDSVGTYSSEFLVPIAWQHWCWMIQQTHRICLTNSFCFLFFLTSNGNILKQLAL